MQLHHKTDSPVKRHDPAADCSQTNIGSYLTVFNIFFYALLKQSSIANLPESGARALFEKKSAANMKTPTICMISAHTLATFVPEKDKHHGGKHGKIDPVGTDEIDPVKTA